MSPDLPEKLLGISIDDPGERRSRDSDEDEEELQRFVFLGIGERRLAVDVDDVKTITEPPGEFTRVPRAPRAIEGVVDLRGEITAVIEPRTHFPVRESPGESQRLVVFDRPADQQPAAIRVDEVFGVETVPASDVVDAADVEERDAAGGALEHPLIVALVQQKERRNVDVRETIGGDDGGEAESDPLEARGIRDRIEGESVELGADGTSFELDDVDDESESRTEEDGDRDDSSESDEVVVETTALLDVERLLLASGQTA